MVQVDDKSPSRSSPINFFLVDNNVMAHKVLDYRCKRLNWALASAYSGEQSIESYKKDRFAGIDIVILALRVPGVDVKRTVKSLRRMGCKKMMFVLTSTNHKVVVKGATGVLREPLRVTALCKSLLHAHSKPTRHL